MNERLCLVPLAGALALLACSHAQTPPPPTASTPAASAPAAPSAPDEEVPALKLPPDERPTHYALHFAIDPEQSAFSGVADIDVTLQKARRTVWINGRELKVTQAWVEANGQRQMASYRQVTEAGVARLDLPAEVGPGKVALHLEWSRPFEHRAVGLYKTTEANVDYVATQFEAVDARRAFPSFDQPEYKTPFDVTLTVPQGDVAIANTPETASRPTGDGRKEVQFLTTKPLPTYLVAMVVGPFDVVQGPTLPPNAIRSYPLPTRGVAPKGRGKELAWALEAGAHLVETEERYFRIAYPYPKLDEIAIPDFAYGAMENAGAIIYREEVLLFREGEASPSDKFLIADVMAHEIAHQWFGDLVTMPFWTDAWLNEAFATWMGTRSLHEWNPKLGPSREALLHAVFNAMHADSLPSARAVRQPLTRIEDVWNQFDGLTYDKGAALLGMFERWVGVEKFRQGIHDYLTAHAWGSGSTDDLLASISRAAGQNIAAPFHSFLDQPGVPVVSVKAVCDASGARLALSQAPYAPLGVSAPKDRMWGIPVCIRYATGRTERETCNLLAEKTAEVQVETCPDWVFPNADAVGYYRWALDGKSLSKLEGKTLDQLSVPERMDFAANLAADVQSGAVQYADALKAVAPLAREMDPGLALPPISLLTLAKDELVPADQKVQVEAYGRALYKPLWAKLGWNASPHESTSLSILRSRVLEFLTVDVGDPIVSGQAAKKGVAYAALGQPTFDAKAVAPELAGTALSVAVREGDGALFEGLVQRLPTLADARLRTRVLAALTFTRDPQRLQQALSLSLAPALRANERIIPLMAAASRPETREQAWTFLQGSFDALAKEIPPDTASKLPRLFAGFCDPAHAAQVKAFFGARLGTVPGAALPLAHAVEQIQICAAEKAAQAESATRFFRKPPMVH